jgi:beta-1,4-mannosyl-glycoprotein beta-1,4-N-acetylglucosaminyltransferase
MKPKIYDCFTYFNEDQLLKLRLETLWDHVDYFVICESVLTHTGKPKPINFEMRNYKKYQEKIRYLLIEQYDFETNDPWVYENYQRNYLTQGLYDAQAHDWIMISDVDEIPNPETFKQYNPYKYTKASLHQIAYVYYLNNMAISENGRPFICTGAAITTYKNLVEIFKCPERLRNYRGGADLLRGIRKAWMKWRTQAIHNGGWHFTWMGGVERVILKMRSYAHQEFYNEAYCDPLVIEKLLRAGGSVLNPDNPGQGLQLKAIDEQFPKYLQTNTTEFSNLILLPDEKTVQNA